MSKLRPKAALAILLGMAGWAGVVLRGADRPTVADKVDRADVDRLDVEITSIDPEADNSTRLEVPPRVTAGSADPDCNVVGGYLISFEVANGYRGNVFRVTADADVKEIKMELAFAGTANFSAAIHQRQTDGRYTQIGSTIELFGRIGAGVSTPVLVTTEEIDPPIHLTAGSDYAIGFAWGPAYNVTFGRNSVSHPVAFEVGQTLGSVVRNNLGTPLVPLEFATLSVFSGGSYSMEVCLVPEPGACCDAADQSCHEVLSGECLGAGSFFHGERTSCAETVCRFGACCDPCGTCGDDRTSESCALEGGIEHWSGVSCPTPQSLLCPKITGACCNGITCSETMCRAECLASGGTYRGDGTNCSPNMCKGACCITSGCQDRTAANCASPNVFKGLGTSCLTLSHDNVCGGGCCRGFTITELDTCESVPNRYQCAYDPSNPGPPSGYRGDGTSCPAEPSTGCNDRVYGACCMPDGTCINTTSAFCNVTWIQGTFNGSVHCEDAAPGQSVCSASLNRCCFPDGTCRLLTQKGCTAFQGTYTLGDPTCGANECASPTGACCGDAAGICSVLTQSQCLANGGHYQGNSTNCSVPAITCPGFGSCCRDEGDCLENIKSNQCSLIFGGNYLGNASECGPSVDCDDRGACCAETGTCLLATADECARLAGESVFNGTGTTCSSTSCPRGACCIGETCQIRTRTACEAASGEFHGDGSVCTANLCTLGACCNQNTCTGLAALAGMVGCLEGPGVTAVTDCECHDLDADGDVDLADVAAFLSGSVAP